MRWKTSLGELNNKSSASVWRTETLAIPDTTGRGESGQIRGICRDYQLYSGWLIEAELDAGVLYSRVMEACGRNFYHF